MDGLMVRRHKYFLFILSVALLLNCDDQVPWLEFPADVVSRHYKIGNVATGEDPEAPQAFLAAFGIIEGLSQGGSGDVAVVTVPEWVHWDGYVSQEISNLCETLRTYEVEIHFLVDPLPHRYYLGGQDPPPPGSSFAIPAVRQTFKDYTLDVINRIDPEYISLGVEINMYYHDFGIEDFVHLNSLINETAGIIRALSPETKILTTFQWEHIFLFVTAGGWEPIDDFEWNVDIIGLSTFPMGFLMFMDPSKLPENYYTQIFDHLPPNITPEILTLAFAELGFPSRLEAGGLLVQDGSEKHQNNGVVTFIQHHATKFERVAFVNYWYLHDNPTFAGMASLGLIEGTTTPGGTPGREKPAYFVWEQLGRLPYIP